MRYMNPSSGPNLGIGETNVRISRGGTTRSTGVARRGELVNQVAEKVPAKFAVTETTRRGSPSGWCARSLPG
jgi:hypothetical protein